MKSLPVPCALHSNTTVFCSRFPHLLSVELELQAHIQCRKFGLFFSWLHQQHQFSVPPSVMPCCIALVIAGRPGAWRRSSKKRQDLVSLRMSVTYNTVEETTRRGLAYGTDMQSRMHRLLTRISQELTVGQSPPRRL